MTFNLDRRSLRAALIAAALLAGSTSFAQIGAAVLTGTVQDAASKQPVADVVVTLTSPNLQGEQVVVTDNTGVYRIPQLPPGTYTIRAEKESYKPFSRGDINLRADATTRLNLDILPEALQGTDIVVVGRPPTIDVGSTTAGVSLGTDFVRNFAVAGTTARSFESLAEVAPGAHGDLFGTSIAGTTSPENNYVIDGLSVNDPAFGVNGAPLSIEFIQELNVITGGFLPEYGRAQGGILNVVTKSGSNEFHGSIFGTFTPGGLVADTPTIPVAGSVISGKQKLFNRGDFGAEIGGPILKDKLWFYAGINPSFQRVQATRNLNFLEYHRPGSTDICTPTVDPTCTIPITDPKTGYQLQHPFTDGDGITGKPLTSAPFQQQGFQDVRNLQYIGKLTYLINQDHNISITTYGTPSQQFNKGGVLAFNGAGNGSPDSLGQQLYGGAYDTVIKESSSFADKHFLLDLSLGWHHQLAGTHPRDNSTPGTTTGLAGIPAVEYRRGSATHSHHSILDFENLGDAGAKLCEPAGKDVGTTPMACPVTTYFTGSEGFVDDVNLDRYQGRAVLTYILKALGHHVIKGGGDAEHLEFQHTKAYTGTVFYRESTSGRSFGDFRQYGFMTGPDTPFIQQKQVARSQSNTIGGFLQDSWSVADLFTLAGGVRYDSQTIIGDDGQIGLAMPNEWSPRIGLIYDFTQQGRSKLYANYAKFYESVPLDIADRSFPGERQVESIHSAAAGKCSNPTDPTQYGPGGACRDPKNLIAPYGLGNPTPNNYWLITGGDREPVDPNVKPESTDEIQVGGEYEVFADARLGANYVKRTMNDIIEDMSRDEGNTYFIGNPGFGIASDFPHAVRNYDAVNVYFTKTFSDLWQAQLSYTWSQLYGNWAGLFRPETGQLDPNINSDFDLLSLLPNRYGPLPGDVTHSIKAYAQKEFVLTGAMSISLGLTYRGDSGAPISYLGSHPLYGEGEAFILPRGSGGRTPWIHSIDSNLHFTYRFSKDSTVSVGVDVFNLFNFLGIAAVDDNYTFTDVLPIYNPGSPCKESTSVDCKNPATFKDLETVNPDGTVTSRLKHTDGSPFNVATDVNPNFKNVTAYQAPRSVRFNARFTF